MTATAVNVLVLCGYGLNCDRETAHAFELAGARVRRVHINDLVRRRVALDDCHILVFGGGFSWGDDHGAGVVQAVRLKTRLGDDLARFVARGNLVLGICNGFQTLVNLGLLPGFAGRAGQRRVALAANAGGNFRDAWVTLEAEAASPCVFTRGMTRLDLPVRHGEGRLVAPPEVIARLGDTGQVALRYARPDGGPAGGQFPHNPNGSLDDIAGICDATGRVFGLMPHPEGYHHPTQHPDWPREYACRPRDAEAAVPPPAPGVQLLQNGVRYAARHLTA